MYKSRSNFKYLRALVLKMTLVCVFSSASFAQEGGVDVVVDNGQGGQEVVKLSRTQRLMSKAVKHTTDYIAELQETISFNKGFKSGLGIGISNSRKLFPLSSGDFIVTDETSVEADFHINAFKNSLKDIQTSVVFQGAAKPSVKRFLVSPSIDKREDTDYERILGPSGTEVYYGFDDNSYELGAGIRVDSVRYARYNNWFSRFTQNITHFPLSAELADQMEIGEGYSFTFEGAASFGPSILSSFLTGGDVSFGANFKFLKIIRSGKFELIIVKTEGHKLLFSIRQVRTIGDSNFKMTWGAHVGPNLDILLGSDKPGFLPTVPKVLSYQRERLDTVEERYNSVYEIDLSNPVDREVYNKTLSTFDFSLLEVFTMEDISTTSNILNKFRQSSLKLLLDMKTKVNVLERNTEIKSLISKRENTRRRESFVNGEASIDGRDVQVAGGSLIDIEEASSYLWGKELDRFELKAYEEYGRQASSDPDDVVLLARKTFFDDYTEHYQKDFGAAIDKNELFEHVKEFNYFTPNLNDISFDQSRVDGIRNLETTQGVIEFFITRGDISNIAFYSEQALKEIVVHIMAERTAFRGETLSANRQRELLTQDPADWSFWFRKDIREAFRKFILGHRDLRAAMANSSETQRAVLSAQALSKMLSFPALAQSYARIFRYMLEDIGRVPKINIAFRNSYLKIDYVCNRCTEENLEGASGALVLEEELTRATDGLSYFDNINKTHLQSVKLNGSLIDVNFWINSKFNGFVKIILKKEVQGDSSVYGDAAEFIVNLSNQTPGRDFRFNLNGNSDAEMLANRLYTQFGFTKVFVALSFDNKVYDEQVGVK